MKSPNATHSQGAKLCLTTEIISREYERTHDGRKCPFVDDDFPPEQLTLSLDEFSRKQGWMK